jgi:hypothetical protein
MPEERKRVVLPPWAWIAAAVLVIGIIAAGYRTVHVHHQLIGAQANFARAKDETSDAAMQAKELKKQLDNSKSELEAAKLELQEKQS